VFRTLQLDRILRRGERAEEAELIAAESYAQLVEHQELPEANLARLGEARSAAVVLELQGPAGLVVEKVTIKEVAPLSGPETPCVSVSLDAG
jgi:hypothetical protein